MKYKVTFEANCPDDVSEKDFLDFLKFELGTGYMDEENELDFADLTHFAKKVKIEKVGK